MRRRSALLLAAGLAACGNSSSPPPPVLTLLPAAFAGGDLRDGRRCAAPGQTLEADVWVHEPTVTFTVRGTADSGSLIARLGNSDARAEITAAPVEVTLRLRPAGGIQRLGITRPAGDRGDLCVEQVALTQP